MIIEPTPLSQLNETWQGTIDIFNQVSVDGDTHFLLKNLPIKNTAGESHEFKFETPITMSTASLTTQPNIQIIHEEMNDHSDSAAAFEIFDATKTTFSVKLLKPFKNTLNNIETKISPVISYI